MVPVVVRFDVGATLRGKHKGVEHMATVELESPVAEDWGELVRSLGAAVTTAQE